MSRLDHPHWTETRLHQIYLPINNIKFQCKWNLVYGGVSVSHLYNSRRLVPLKDHWFNILPLSPTYTRLNVKGFHWVAHIYERILVQLPNPLYKSMQNSYNVRSHCFSWWQDCPPKCHGKTICRFGYQTSWTNQGLRLWLKILFHLNIFISQILILLGSRGVYSSIDSYFLNVYLTVKEFAFESLTILTICFKQVF